MKDINLINDILKIKNAFYLKSILKMNEKNMKVHIQFN